MNLKNTTLKFHKILFLIGGILVLQSCESWFDINTSKDTPATVTIEKSLPVVIFYASQICYDHAEYGVYLSQALTTGGRSQTGGYAYKSGWEFLSMNRHPQWRRHFYDIGVNANELIKNAEKEANAKNYILIARTIKLHSTLLTTDAFGDIPHSQVYKSNSPTYDTQESIYEWMLKEANELIALYDNKEWVNAQNKAIDQSVDRLFGGNMGKWRAFAKSLKARILLRKLPNWENTNESCNAIIEAVNAALNDPSYSDAIYKYDGGSAEKNCPWGPAQPKLNLGWAQARENLLSSAIPSKFFSYGLLGVYSAYKQTTGYALDPRAEALFGPREGRKMLSIENNIGMAASAKITEYPYLYGDGTDITKNSNPYTQNDGYIMLMSEEELLFIKAEAEYWKNENKAAAYHTTVAAVKKNMERVGVKTENANQKKFYDLFFEVRLPGESSFTIADLMQQKYVAMYLQPELWTDIRRYNYSSKTNGITYDGKYVYTIEKIHDDKSNTIKPEDFSQEFSLTRPFNLYEPYWNTGEEMGINAKFSPNAWIMRLNPDPETEDKYNRKELERLGAYKNPQWLKKRMIWAQKNNNYVTAADDTPWK